MGRPTTLIIIILTIYLSVNIASSCSLQGLTNWFLDLTVIDTDRGVMFQTTTTDIEGIQTASHSGDDLNTGPYFFAAHNGSHFTLSLHDNFADYEEHETARSMSVEVIFSCTNGGTLTHLFIIGIIDTNNNDPIFTPTDTITFKVMPPLPPGYQLTSSLNSIIARDIDLTTQRIDFGIEDNDYFEILYDTTTPYAVKSFGAILRTTSFIRSLPEPVTVRISATDVDLTGDPPRTMYANLVIEADGDFVFPEEPIFSQVFYLASYSGENEVSLQNPIYLQQGYDEFVSFNITGEYAEYFNLVGEENLSVGVTSPPPLQVIALGTILLELRAIREYTSGATATLIIQFPTEMNIAFAEPHYEGTVIDNILSLPVLTLAQGYENGFNITFESEHSTYFSNSAANNLITVTMSQLPADVIQQNNFLTLQVIATSSTSSTSTIVFLEIIKDDTTTPVFEAPIYIGSYSSDTGLSLDSIILSQGFDNTVQFHKEGVYESYFNLTENGNAVTLQLVSSLPEQLLEDEQNLLLTIRATKPRTVGAHTAVSIDLPAARTLNFERPSYSGQIESNTINLETILLSNGYASDVNFTLLGEYNNFFSTTNNQNQVTIGLSSQLTESIILNNNFLALTLQASGSNALTAITNVVLEIIKDDLSTPVFGYPIYYGDFQGTNEVNVQDISLTQGYDNTVIFRLNGEHSQYFTTNTDGNNVAISLQSTIPEDVIYNEKVLIFTIIADKPLTVGATAAVSINFPSELIQAATLEFSENIYVGALENNVLFVESISLQTGFSTNTQFTLNGDYAEYFNQTNNGNVVTLSLSTPLPPEVIQNDKFILLDLSAERDRAITATTAIVIEIIVEDVLPPVFSASYYHGSYNVEGELEFQQTISLNQGFDSTVSFELEGEHSEWFSFVQNSNEVDILLEGSIPEEVIANYNNLLFTIVANKPDTFGGKAAISIELPNGVSVVVLRFTQSSYVGSIENGVLQMEPMALAEEYDIVNFTLHGEFNDYFTIEQAGNLLTLSLSNDLPVDAFTGNTFIRLDIEVSQEGAISGFTTAVIEIIQDISVVMPIFDRPFYTGWYSDEGLLLDYTIQLAQGYDDTVQFAIGNEADARWFSISSNGNSLTLSIIDEDLSEVSDRSHLLFSVIANKPGTLPGLAAVVISLPDTPANVLRFSQTHYSGSIEDDTLILESIAVSNGHSEDATFNLIGDHIEYFNLTYAGDLISIQLITELPPEITDNINVLILTLEGRAASDVAYSTLVIELVKTADVEIRALMFQEAHYSGSYSEIDGLAFDHEIRLMDHFDEDVIFTLDGDQSHLFTIQPSSDFVFLTVNQIPSDVLANYQYLLLSISANKVGFLEGKAAIVISLIDDYLSPAVLRFEQSRYLGQVYSDSVSLVPIVISEGYNDNTSYSLAIRGDLEEYFTYERVGNTITLTMASQIPENILETNKIVLLELEVSAIQAISAFTTIILETSSVVDNLTSLVFAETYYTGSYRDETLNFVNVISLEQGYNENVLFTIQEGFEEWFTVNQNGNEVNITLANAIPVEMLLNNHNLIFTVSASHVGYLSAKTTVVISLEDDLTTAAVLRFNSISYQGHLENQEVNLTPIVLSEGYSDEVTFSLQGELSEYFEPENEESVVTIKVSNPIPENLLVDEQFIVLDIIASRQQSISALATIILTMPRDIEESPTPPVFSESYYIGHYSLDEGLTIETNITLLQGYDNTVQFNLQGEDASWFSLQDTGINSVVLLPSNDIPVAELSHLLLSVVATKPGATNAEAAIFIFIQDDGPTNPDEASFERALYTGSLEQGVVQHETITISGYSGNTVEVFGDYSELFAAEVVSGEVSVQATGAVPDDTAHVALELHVGTARTVLLIIISGIVGTPPIDDDVSFDKAVYQGDIVEGVVEHETITVTGFEGTAIDVLGVYSEMFNAEVTSGVVLVQAVASMTLPEGTTHVALELQAGRARTALVLSVDSEVIPPITDDVSFDKALYEGAIIQGLVEHETITITGFEGTTINIAGVYSELFNAEVTSGVVSVQAVASMTLPEGTTHVALELQAESARTALVLSFDSSEEVPPITEVASFDKALYEGTIAQGVVQHEMITITGFDGTNINVFGVFSEFFVAEAVSGIVSIQATGSVTLPENTTHIALELQASTARTALVLSVTQTDEHIPDPTVTFSAPSYDIRTDITQTGLIGRVQATADNGERLTYSLLTNNAHLLERLSVTEDGDLHLSASVNSGVYTFIVTATTIFTQVSDSAMVHLTVDAITVCGVDDRVLPPLMILNGDEEMPHTNLVVLNGTPFADCHFSLTNRWPLDQDWLFVDETGLHARVIDREHESIAFMALSQVQVELILHCDSDELTATRSKRSLNNRLEWLGPYDYGSNKWVLTDTIRYNSRRSFVNFIVNDINDNDPIFIGKESEPIAVGYPVPELLNVVMPRALIKLKATDADIGENAALLYWTPEPELAVSPTTGTVHIRDNERILQEGTTFEIHASDRNGEGNIGSIQLVLRLLDVENIAVITVRDSFFDDEEAILINITEAVGYDVRALTSVVISDEYETEEETRFKRQAVVSRGASLQIYVYGLVEKIPVDVEQLITDINSNLVASVVVADSISLEDYLENTNTNANCGSDVGLLVSTIVLSFLLFILMVFIALWFYIKRRKNRNHDNFSDEISIASKAESIDVTSKPDTLTRPRLNIDELKRSERRLQEMLNAPIDTTLNVTVEPTTTRTNPDTKIDVVPTVHTNVPIVIQSKDKLKDAAASEDEDEFGEVKSKAGRKSVVTFNEVVEKIIHVDDGLDTPDNSSDFVVERF